MAEPTLKAVTTDVFGEEGTTQFLGEEATTQALGEEHPTPSAMGAEAPSVIPAELGEHGPFGAF